MSEQTVKELRKKIKELEKQVKFLDTALWRSAIAGTKTIQWIYENCDYEAATEAAVFAGILKKEEADLMMSCEGQRPS